MRGERAGKSDNSMKRKKINFSDIPEMSNKPLSRMHRVGRRTKGDKPRKLIAIRLDAKLLGWLRKTADKKGCLINHSSTRYWPSKCAKRVSPP